MKNLYCIDCKTIVDRLDDETYLKHEGKIASKQYMVDNSSCICPECLLTTTKDNIKLQSLYQRVKEKYKYDKGENI
jgi:hypothetical protein